MSPEVVVRREVKTRQAPWAWKIALALARAGVRPNAISWTSVLCALACSACLVGAGMTGGGRAVGLFVAAAVFIQLRLLCNLFDGMVAVEGGLKTKSGEIFNDLPDRLSDPLIFIGAGYAAHAAPFGVELGWLAGVLAVLTAYVRLLGGANGVGQLFLGPMAKQHRMAVMTVASIAASISVAWDRQGLVMAVALGVVAVGCVVTVIRRAVRIVKTLEAS